MFAVNKTHVKGIDEDFGYLRSAQLGQYARNHPALTQLVTLQVETQEVDSCNQI